MYIYMYTYMLRSTFGNFRAVSRSLDQKSESEPASLFLSFSIFVVSLYIGLAIVFDTIDRLLDILFEIQNFCKNKIFELPITVTVVHARSIISIGSKRTHAYQCDTSFTICYVIYDKFLARVVLCGYANAHAKGYY